MGRRQREKLLAFVEAATSEAVSVLTRRGLSDDQARAAAAEWVERIVARFQRGYMYVPVKRELDLAARDAEIYRLYCQDGPEAVRRNTRDRAEQLVEQFELSVQQIYSIVRLERHREQCARQAALDAPGLENPLNPSPGRGRSIGPKG